MFIEDMVDTMITQLNDQKTSTAMRLIAKALDESEKNGEVGLVDGGFILLQRTKDGVFYSHMNLDTADTMEWVGILEVVKFNMMYESEDIE